MRIGHGYDVHQFADGRKCIIGGVEIPYEKGLLGHSDADVLLHAVSDALLGAAALGDIGGMFPDSRQLAGTNSHHIIEGTFKSVARTLKDAVAIDPAFKDEIPSTKGVL